MPRTRAVRGKIVEKLIFEQDTQHPRPRRAWLLRRRSPRPPLGLAPAKEKPPSPWLPLTRELSPQATEGENSQPVCSGRFTMVRAISLPPSNPSGLPPPSSEGGKTKAGGRRTGDRAFCTPLRCRNGVSAETPAIRRGQGVGVGPLQSSSMAVFWGGSTWPTMALQGAKGRSSAKSRSA